MQKVTRHTPLAVSKWIKLPSLLAVSEMADLLRSMEPSATCYYTHQITKNGEGIFTREQFLTYYAEYINYLLLGETPPFEVFRSKLSCALSVTDEAFQVMEIDATRTLIQPCLPIIQIQLSSIRYSVEEGNFRTQVFGSDCIAWGVVFSFPQIFQDPKSCDIFPTRSFANGHLFHHIQKWMRAHTCPTPFMIGGTRRVEPIRLGKLCKEWINRHPQLIISNISVDIK